MGAWLSLAVENHRHAASPPEKPSKRFLTPSNVRPPSGLFSRGIKRADSLSVRPEAPKLKMLPKA
jgi:hypothetical protein